MFFVSENIQIAQLHLSLQRNNESSAHQLQENATSFMVHQACRTMTFDDCFILVHQAEHTSQLPYLQGMINFDKEKLLVWPNFAYLPGTLS